MVSRRQRLDGNGRRWAPLIFLLTSFGLLGVAAAQSSLDKTLEKLADKNKAMAESQQRIEEASGEAYSLVAQYRNVERRNASLAVYNQQLGTLLAAQQGELDSLRKQIDNVTVIGRQITPLLLRMIDALDAFVELDVPFLIDERKLRVQTLREMMARADVEDAEKYRRLMEAYQIENEYGRTIEAYRGELPGDDEKRTVDFLRIGRVALLYMTMDRDEAGSWDADAKTWKPLPREYYRTLPKAFRVARKQDPPALLRMLVPAPKAVN